MFTNALSREAIFGLLVMAFVSVFISLRFYLGYRYFADHFAITVYRDFFVLEQMLATGQPANARVGAA